MKAELKRINANPGQSLEEFQPDNPECFGWWLNASIGPDASEGADDFQIFVCNRAWLDQPEGRHRAAAERFLLLEGPYAPNSVLKALETHLEKCVGDRWTEVVERVSKIGYWEFEDYQI